jgi:aldose sugar dehydrogenase
VFGLETLFRGEYGRLRDVVEGPDGALYVSTSNRDGRGSPQPGDDRLLRITVR